MDIKPKTYYIAQLASCSVGAPQKVVYGKDNVTTGASSDYAHVYATARQMVTVWGFGELNYDYMNMSYDAAKYVDDEIDALVKKCYAERSI